MTAGHHGIPGPYAAEVSFCTENGHQSCKAQNVRILPVMNNVILRVTKPVQCQSMDNQGIDQNLTICHCRDAPGGG